ncbi:MAG TPA: hypothetical protein VH352_10220 [Pseudonocardiaceae bacterium]|nr:hypothetical protein [Pseudonocardiaceae bacterium]
MLPTPLSIRPTSGLRFVLVALVLGLVLGAGAVGLTWFVAGGTATAARQPTTAASLDAATACADLARLPAPSSPSFTVLAVQGAPDGVFRLAGAAVLAQAAEAEDAHYKPLSDAINNADRLVEQWVDASSGPQARNALAAARAACVNQ